MNTQVLNSNITLQRNKKSTLISSSLIIISVILMVMTITEIKDTESSLYFMAISVSLAVFVIGLIKIFINGKEKIFIPTRSRVRDISIKFSLKDYPTIRTAFETGDMRMMEKLEESESTEIRMDIMISDDNQFAACQIFEWVPYNYEAKSDPYILKPNSILGLRLFLEKRNNK